MKIEHIALWTKNIEVMREFYTGYFGGNANKKYRNDKNSFESYFLHFDNGARLELMKRPDIPENKNDPERQFIGITHIAFSVGSREKVIELTRRLKNAGYEVIKDPRTTGDGYFESTVLDPEKNIIEITE